MSEPGNQNAITTGRYSVLDRRTMGHGKGGGDTTGEARCDRVLIEGRNLANVPMGGRRVVSGDADNAGGS